APTHAGYNVVVPSPASQNPFEVQGWQAGYDKSFYAAAAKVGKGGKPGDNYGSPQDVVDLLDGNFHFNVDVAAADERIAKVKSRFFTPAMDGKRQELGP